MAWRNQPWLFVGAAISTTRAVVPVGVAEVAQLVDLLVDPVEDLAFPAARLALVVTRSLRVPARPSVSHGIAASLPTASRATSPARVCLGGVAGRSCGRSACGPAASTSAQDARPCATAPSRRRDDVLRRALGDDAGRRPSPASGPRSMTQSAVLITSRLCSTTMTVLPRSTRRLSTSSSLRMSSKCRPVVGSSRR